MKSKLQKQGWHIWSLLFSKSFHSSQVVTTSQWSFLPSASCFPLTFLHDLEFSSCLIYKSSTQIVRRSAADDLTFISFTATVRLRWLHFIPSLFSTDRFLCLKLHTANRLCDSLDTLCSRGMSWKMQSGFMRCGENQSKGICLKEEVDGWMGAVGSFSTGNYSSSKCRSELCILCLLKNSIRSKAKGILVSSKTLTASRISFIIDSFSEVSGYAIV